MEAIKTAKELLSTGAMVRLYQRAKRDLPILASLETFMLFLCHAEEYLPRDVLQEITNRFLSILLCCR